MVNTIKSEDLANKNIRQRGNPDGPPAIDESWWEAVLAEDEARSHLGSNLRPSNQNKRGSLTKETQSLSQRPTSSSSEIDWERALELYRNDQMISLMVTNYNRGGLLVNGDGLQGFVPVSHLIDAPNEAVEPEEWLETYLEHSLRLKIIECDPERGRVVFSERAALAESGVRNELLHSLKSGVCIQGTVTNITDFGVFVDLGGVEGLVHVSEISWGRVHHPADVVTIGQEVNVYIIQVDPERARVALSLKRLYPNPWETAHERYFPGQITEATVTSIVPFGAFARLEEGLDGLIHISEMVNGATSSQAGNGICEGQNIKVRVLHVDCTRQRLGLSLNLDNNAK